MTFEQSPRKVNRNELLPGATPEQMQKSINILRRVRSESHGIPEAFQSALEQLKNMANGGEGEGDQERVDHEGGVDDKGEYAAFTEIKSLRDVSYPGWKDEDFVKLLEALGESVH